MRLIAAVGIFEEVSQDEYALTRRSLNLSDPSYANWVEYFQEDVFGTFAKLHTYYSSHPLESPTSPCYNPYSWAFDMEGQDFISVAGRTPEKLRKFSIGISVRYLRKLLSSRKLIGCALIGNMGWDPCAGDLSFREGTCVAFCCSRGA